MGVQRIYTYSLMLDRKSEGPENQKGMKVPHELSEDHRVLGNVGRKIGILQKKVTAIRGVDQG
jgi:hypothetical protein